MSSSEQSGTTPARVATSLNKSRPEPARAAEIPRIHGWLMEVIAGSPHYSDEFKAFEMARLSKQFLYQLHGFNSSHILVHRTDNDDIAGFMISGPELGTLWLYWSYLRPDYRKSRLAVTALQAFAHYWDNNRFHKIATYTKPGNDVAEALMQRYGFSRICLLENHIFGEDYLLYERPLTKSIQGYDHGLPSIGRLGRLKQTISRLLSKNG